MHETNTKVEANPQIESKLNDLATICCDAINGDRGAGLDQIDALLNSLLINGYVRLGVRPLQVDLETRVKQKCGGCLESGATELRSLSGEIAKQFALLLRRESGLTSESPLRSTGYAD